MNERKEGKDTFQGYFVLSYRFYNALVHSSRFRAYFNCFKYNGSLWFEFRIENRLDYRTLSMMVYEEGEEEEG